MVQLVLQGRGVLMGYQELLDSQDLRVRLVSLVSQVHRDNKEVKVLLDLEDSQVTV